MTKIIGLIPSRLNSTRLPGKALADIEGLPLVVHTAKRAKLAQSLDAVYVCTDSNEIQQACSEHGIDSILTPGKYQNGTERIASVANSMNSDYIVDIQGDEPLINPAHIDIVSSVISSVEFAHEIALPVLRVPYSAGESIVKVQASQSGRVMTLSRSSIPCRYAETTHFVNKHLSIVGFTSSVLSRYSEIPPSPYEVIESIELLRYLENDISIGSFCLQGDSFSVDIQDDLDRARAAMRIDPFRGSYS
jgi:3-deoxy-manno-octulosonate cytidylyltransferase (CMP-KDO synthetase)